MSTQKLFVNADLSPESIKQAEKQLGGHTSNCVIGATSKQLTQFMMDWLWQNRRGHSFWLIPECVLADENTWFIEYQGSGRGAVVSWGPA